MLLVYFPINVPPGMTTEMVGMIVYIPAPVEAGVPKNSTGGGGVPWADGRATIPVMVFVRVGLEQVLGMVQVAVVPRMVEASAGIVPAEPVNAVELMERCHPSSVPLRSLLVNGIVYVIVLPGVPVMLYDTSVFPPNEPAMIVPFIVGESATAGVVAPGNRQRPMSNITSSKPPLEMWWKCFV